MTMITLQDLGMGMIRLWPEMGTKTPPHSRPSSTGIFQRLDRPGSTRLLRDLDHETINQILEVNDDPSGHC